MLKITNTDVAGIGTAIRGMRNPLQSWKNSDSNGNTIGMKDLELAQRLIRAGKDHSKFMRQIYVACDITAPLYFWKEADTYKLATVANSTSTMHNLTKREFYLQDFSVDDDILCIGLHEHTTYGSDEFITIDSIWDDILYALNSLRNKYLATKDPKDWRALIQMLPSSYNQTRTWTANYEVLRNIYFARKNHKLSEWHQFCEWIETLPYAKELITYKGDNVED